jgi:hypothetical protein
MPAILPPDQLYTVISYTPAAQKGLFGTAIIQVNGCVLQTSIDMPFGITQGTVNWNNVVDPVVAAILVNMDPNSPTYDPSLLGN